LKRFSFSSYSGNKIETSIQIPLQGLSLEQIMSSTQGRDRQTSYNLFGVSCHSGGLRGGHYVAHCKNPDDGRWYLRNDARVSPSGEGIVAQLGSTAYVLFFQRVSSAPGGGAGT
ncbi:hypothetical protein HK405_005394, partial [Cladochytrium tenue]